MILGLHTKFQLNQTKGLIDRCYLVSEAAGSLKVKHEIITNFDFSPTYKISANWTKGSINLHCLVFKAAGSLEVKHEVNTK